MVYSIHLEASASGETAQAALLRAPHGEVALIFPLGTPCALCDVHELEALYTTCVAREIVPIIVGGDHLLRAHAVAVGFAAATSVEEWETSTHRAIRARREALIGSRHGRGHVDLTGPAMSLVSARGGDDSEASGRDLYSLDSGDPPAYVADLVALVAMAQAERHMTVPTVPMQRGRKTHELDETIRDRHDAEALERAQQLFEEHLTETIRLSSSPASEEGQGPRAERRGGDADN